MLSYWNAHICDPSQEAAFTQLRYNVLLRFVIWRGSTLNVGGTDCILYSAFVVGGSLKQLDWFFFLPLSLWQCKVKN